jgi:hypothetical protein
MYEKTVNLCDNKKKPDMIKANLAIFAVPPRCPVTKSSTFCNDGSKTVMKFSEASQKLFEMFVMYKEVIIKMNITHDTGNSCIEAEHKVIRKA